MKKILYIVFIATLFTSCATIEHDFIKTGSSFNALEESEEILLIITDREIPPYEEIGVLDIYNSGVSGAHNRADYVEEALLLAREYGADIVILQDVIITEFRSETGQVLTTRDSGITVILGKIIK